MLLESMIAIVLITVVMTALTVLFVTSMKAAVHQRGSQNAIHIATDEVDSIRGLGYSGALSGRDEASVTAQFASASTKARSWLLTSADQAFDATATSPEGATPCVGDQSTGCALLPTTGITRTLGGTDFTVQYYAEWCYRAGAAAADANCVAAADADLDHDLQYLRVVVDISWDDRSCGATACHYLTSLLLNGKTEPTFYFNTDPPPKPDLTTCSPKEIAVGDTFSEEAADVTTDDAGHLVLPPAGLLDPSIGCALDGGVPPFTWAGHGLPSGLAVAESSHIIGTVADDATTASNATIDVTDAFIFSDTSEPFTWTVLPELTITGAEDQTGTVGESVKVNLNATGGEDSGYSWEVTGLPDGLHATEKKSRHQRLKITGTPTAAGEYEVTVAVSDAATPVHRKLVMSFTWTVQSELKIASMAEQTSIEGEKIDDLPIVVSGGSGQYSVEVTGLPDGLTAVADDDADGDGRPDGFHIEGTPESADDDPSEVTITVTDTESEATASVTFDWTVHEAPDSDGDDDDGDD